MYQKVLVPLDGSKLAECVLPHVQSIVSGCGVRSAEFVRVIEPGPMAMGDDGGAISPEDERKITAANWKEAEDYLNALVSRISYDNVKTGTKVLSGKAAEVIADYATKNGADLIVIATHGRSGVSRWVWGSVADRVLRSACVPVLMVRAPGCIPGI